MPSYNSTARMPFKKGGEVGPAKTSYKKNTTYEEKMKKTPSTGTDWETFEANMALLSKMKKRIKKPKHLGDKGFKAVKARTHYPKKKIKMASKIKFK